MSKKTQGVIGAASKYFSLLTDLPYSRNLGTNN